MYRFADKFNLEYYRDYKFLKEMDDEFGFLNTSEKIYSELKEFLNNNQSNFNKNDIISFCDFEDDIDNNNLNKFYEFIENSTMLSEYAKIYNGNEYLKFYIMSNENYLFALLNPECGGTIITTFKQYIKKL